MKKTLKNIIILLAILLYSTGAVFCADYFEEGKRAYYSGNYKAACTYFQYALTQNPYNVNYRYYYAQSLIGISKLNDAQREYERIIEISPSSEAAKLSSIGITKIQDYFLNQKNYYTRTASGSIDFIGENYINNAQNSGNVMRWSLKKMPLKVFISNGSKVQGYQPYYYNAVKQAFDTWVRSLDGIVKYTMTTNPQEANIQIFFVQDIYKKSGEHFVTGLATPKISKNILKSVEVKFKTIKPDNTPFLENEIYNTALHELGHAFGIYGHSSKETDIMYAVEQNIQGGQKRTLSKRDLNTIKLLYKLDADISNFDADEIAGKNSSKNDLVIGNKDTRLKNKLKEAQEYVKKLPDQAISWSSLAKAYYDLGMYSDAILNYKKALAIDSKYIEAKEGIANTYTKMGDTSNAITEYKNLISIDPSNIRYSHNLTLTYINNNRLQEASNVISNLYIKNPSAKDDEGIKNLINMINQKSANRSDQ